MADTTHTLVGKNYTPPDLVAKVTGQAKYAEDFRAEGMLFTKLLLSPMPHARVRNIDATAALAMPGVHAILTEEDCPNPGSAMLGEGVVISDEQNIEPEMVLTNTPHFQGQPILAVAADSEELAADAIERIVVDLEPLPFVVDPIQALRPGSPNPREQGNVWVGNHVEEIQVDRGGLAGDRRRPAPVPRYAGDVGGRGRRRRARGGEPRRRRDGGVWVELARAARIAERDGVLAERQGVSALLDPVDHDGSTDHGELPRGLPQ